MRTAKQVPGNYLKRLAKIIAITTLGDHGIIHSRFCNLPVARVKLASLRDPTRFVFLVNICPFAPRMTILFQFWQRPVLHSSNQAFNLSTSLNPFLDA